MNIYTREKQKKLSDVKKLASNVYVSLVDNLTLSDYANCQSQHCEKIHIQPCVKCNGLLNLVSIIKEKGYCLLSEAFKVTSPGKMYSAEIARRYLLQMPLVCIVIGEPQTGKSFSIVLEKHHGADYSKIAMLLNSLDKKAKSPQLLDKSAVKLLLSIAQSDRERTSLKYAIIKAGNMTPTAARKAYGFENTQELQQRVEDAITTAKRINEAVDDLARVEDRSLLISMGIDLSESEWSEESEDEMVDLPECEAPQRQQQHSVSLDEMCQLMRNSNFNWFEFYEQLEYVPNVKRSCARILLSFARS